MSNRVGQNRETDEEHDEDCVEEGFSWLRQNLTEMVREAGNFWVWGTAVRMFEMNQNRRVTTGTGEISSALLQKLKIGAVIWRKNVLIVVIHG